MNLYKEIVDNIPEKKLKDAGVSRTEVLYYMKYVRYTDDGLFHYVFGADNQESNKLLRKLVSLILNEEVVSMKMENSVIVSQGKDNRKACMDILTTITTLNGEIKRVNIEMQNYGNRMEISSRAQSYIRHIGVWDLKKGGSTPNLHHIHQIMLLGKKKFKSPEYIRKFDYKDSKGELIPASSSDVWFIEFSKLKNLNLDKASELEKLCYFMQYAHVPKLYDKMKLLMEENEMLCKMEERKRKYMMNDITELLMDVRTYYDEISRENEYENAKNEGLEEGISIGEKRLINRLYKHGMSIEEIVEYTGLCIEEIHTYLEK